MYRIAVDGFHEAESAAAKDPGEKPCSCSTSGPVLSAYELGIVFAVPSATRPRGTRRLTVKEVQMLRDLRERGLVPEADIADVDRFLRQEE